MKRPTIFAIYIIMSTCLPDSAEKLTTPSLMGSRKGCDCKPLGFPLLTEFCYFGFISMVKVVSQEKTDLYPKSSDALGALYNPKPNIKGIRYEVMHLQEYRNMNNNTGNIEKQLSKYIVSPKYSNPCALVLEEGQTYILGGIIGRKSQFLRVNLCGWLQWRKKAKYLAFFKNSQCREQDQRRAGSRRSRY